MGEVKNLYISKTSNNETLEVFAAQSPALWTVVVCWKTTIAGQKVIYCESRGDTVPYSQNEYFYGWAPQFGYALRALLKKVAEAQGYKDAYIDTAYDHWLRLITDDDFTAAKWIDVDEYLKSKAKEQEENDPETEKGCIGF